MVEKGHVQGENMYSAMGQTEEGRYIIAFFIHKQDGRALIISREAWMRLRRNDMPENRSSLSGSRSYEELSEYWDTHSLTDHWDQTSPAEFELDVKSSAHFPVDRVLADQLRAVAASHGISTETL
jgi:hypothetical protein